MFVFRVKHLLLVCFLSMLFLYFSSHSEQTKIPILMQSERKHGTSKDPLPHTNDDKGGDAIERFIDKYINVSDDDVIVDSAGGGTTEESLVYLYVVNDSDSLIAKNKGYENDSEELRARIDDEARGALHLENIAGNNLSDLKANNSQGSDYEYEVLTVRSNSQIDESFPSGDRNQLSAPEGDQTWPNPTAEFILREQSIDKTVEVRTPSNETEKAELSIALTEDPEYLPMSPSINKEEQQQMKRDSPIVVLRRDSYWPPVLPPSDAEIFSQINYNKYDPEDRAYLVGRVGVYEERARAVGEVCRNNPHLITLTPIHNFVWDQRHDPNIVWCEISKVASTSWMVNFLRLGHYRENDTSLSHLPQEERDAIRFETQLDNDNLHFNVLRLYPAPNTTTERSHVFSRALRFIIVRHPFSRLLSAYQDKMTTLNPIPRIHNFRQLQKDIIKRYRGNKTIQGDFDPQFPTFAEFVQYVIDSTAKLKTLRDWRKVVCWQPYWAKCGVCAHDFQMIMKLETMVDDEHFLVKLAGLQELDKVFEWRHSRQSTKPKEEFFKQLSSLQMQQLHQRYLLDFQMFGYSIHQFLHLAHDAPGDNV